MGSSSTSVNIGGRTYSGYKKTVSGDCSVNRDLDKDESNIGNHDFCALSEVRLHDISFTKDNTAGECLVRMSAMGESGVKLSRNFTQPNKPEWWLKAVREECVAGDDLDVTCKAICIDFE